jgi:hypothetical protein
VAVKTELVSELELFHRFVGDALRNGGSKMSPEETVAAFRARERELQQLRQDIQPSLDRSLCGASEPLDLNELKAKVSKRLARRGITD